MRFFSVPSFCGVVKRGTGLSCGLRRMTLNVKNRSDSGDDEKHTVLSAHSRSSGKL